ncbi:MAG: GNAT family N-acetyltransferase [Alphaproteobacteria bacterium]
MSAFGPDDAAALTALRREGLEAHPEAFGSSLAEEAGGVPGWLTAQLAAGDVFGAWDGPDLAGMAGLWREEPEKKRHRGGLWGMYVRPARRRRGVGAALVRRVLERAALVGLEQVHLGVGAANPGARALYERLGFVAYGVEPRALKLAAVYVDEVLMVRHLAGEAVAATRRMTPRPDPA